ncbi:hypothetical protein IGI04_009950 [Brassica rapa subsp. trilocularis]|uniref:Uncharacterized protein n=1 Tax=Brassica rapa subsp. trilocularis TaxID=1813537 RepID=A0ABQ7MYQ3_BRACM|nr:hypothetical protein IGI04_009950 [Brassica rapa subsp. trilocularis]
MTMMAVGSDDDDGRGKRWSSGRGKRWSSDDGRGKRWSSDDGRRKRLSSDNGPEELLFLFVPPKVVEEELEKAMSAYGFEILQTLIVDTEPDEHRCCLLAPREEGWFSLQELKQRLVKLREVEEAAAQGTRKGIAFDDPQLRRRERKRNQRIHKSFCRDCTYTRENGTASSSKEERDEIL